MGYVLHGTVHLAPIGQGAVETPSFPLNLDPLAEMNCSRQLGQLLEETWP